MDDDNGVSFWRHIALIERLESGLLFVDPNEKRREIFEGVAI